MFGKAKLHTWVSLEGNYKQYILYIEFFFLEDLLLRLETHLVLNFSILSLIFFRIKINTRGIVGVRRVATGYR